MDQLFQKHLTTYAPEPCARCKGRGKITPGDYADLVFHEAAEIIIQRINPDDSIYDCLVCEGRGCVLVVQPSRKCTYCGGTGAGLQPRCPFCGGTGWMLVRKG
ncbi:MAG TPA: hypothetical protein VNI02_04745 [Blastocatellia bacterium]|nr:hypothetical protein [Blastocatellia bacterium]